MIVRVHKSGVNRTTSGYVHYSLSRSGSIFRGTPYGLYHPISDQYPPIVNDIILSYHCDNSAFEYILSIVYVVLRGVTIAH